MEQIVWNLAQQVEDLQRQQPAQNATDATLQNNVLPTLQGLQQAVQQLQQQFTRQQAPHVGQTVPRTLPSFKIPSAQPPSFDGSAKYKPAHVAQQTIDEYLHKAFKVAKIHGFRADNASAQYSNHPTYVQWVSTGLTGMALTYWRQLSETVQDTMTWQQYKEWIQRHFTSALTLQDATHTLKSLKQKKSASQYSQQFNELVEAIRSKNVSLDDKYLCIIYRDGLKDFLIKENKLYDIEDDLAKLQQEAERLDDHHWRTHSNSRRTGNFSQPPFRNHGNANHRDDPMELDNMQTDQTNGNFRRLSEKEKEFYRSKGWCTFCRSKNHDYNSCDHPNKKNRSGSDNGNRNFNSNKRANNSKGLNTIGGSAAGTQTDEDQ
jgi:hypothetical protein